MGKFKILLKCTKKGLILLHKPRSARASKSKEKSRTAFLKDLDAAKRIVDGLQPNGAYQKVLEIGPGMGVLTQFLVKKRNTKLH